MLAVLKRTELPNLWSREIGGDYSHHKRTRYRDPLSGESSTTGAAAWLPRRAGNGGEMKRGLVRGWSPSCAPHPRSLTGQAGSWGQVAPVPESSSPTCAMGPDPVLQ